MIGAPLLAVALAAGAPSPEAATSTATAAEVRPVEETPELADLGTGQLVQTFVEMVTVLAAVCLLAYLLLAKALPRLLRVPMPTASHRLLSVVDRLPLDPKRSILVVAMGEQHFLVGSSEEGLSLLARLDAGDVREATAAAEARAREVGASRLPFVRPRRTEEKT